MVPTTSERSLWLQTAGSSPSQPPLSGAVAADVVVIGAGMAGASLALALQSSGVEVVLLEARTAGSGVTATTTAKVTALQGAILGEVAKHHGPDTVRDYAQASLSAVQDVAANVAAHGIDCGLERRPAVTYTTEDSQLGRLRAEFELAVGAGLPVRWEDSDAGLPFGVAGAVWLEGQLAIQPIRYVRGLIAAFLAKGGRVFEHSRVRSVSVGSPCRVRTDAGEVLEGPAVTPLQRHPVD